MLVRHWGGVPGSACIGTISGRPSSAGMIIIVVVVVVVVVALAAVAQSAVSSVIRSGIVFITGSPVGTVV